MARAPEQVASSARRRAAAIAGHSGDEKAARESLADPAGAVRASALGALARMGAIGSADLALGLVDPAPEVRRRACDLAGRLGETAMASALSEALADASPAVVEAACYALAEMAARVGGGAGEPGQPGEPGEAGEPSKGLGQPGPGAGIEAAIVDRLVAVSSGHPDALCREAAVAALGCLGSPRGLEAVLAALEDKPAIRRRAVIALAAFDDDRAEAALERAALDSDWQVRQSAEDLLGRRPRPGRVRS
jgi:HEAT repeat protein